MENFEDFAHEHRKDVEKTRADFGSPEQIKTIIDVEALREACAGNEALERFFQDVLDHFYGYSETVWEFQEIAEKSGRGELTEAEYREAYKNVVLSRTRSHDALLSTVNVLARAMKKFNLDSTWIAKLKDGSGQDVRARYSLLALQVTYLHIITAMNQKEGVKA